MIVKVTPVKCWYMAFVLAYLLDWEGKRSTAAQNSRQDIPWKKLSLCAQLLHWSYLALSKSIILQKPCSLLCLLWFNSSISICPPLRLYIHSVLGLSVGQSTVLILPRSQGWSLHGPFPWELDSRILVGPFQLRIFCVCDSMCFIEPASASNFFSYKKWEKEMVSRCCLGQWGHQSATLLENLALIPASVDRLVLFFVETRMIFIYICMCSFFSQHFNTLSFSFCPTSIFVIEF